MDQSNRKYEKNFIIHILTTVSAHVIRVVYSHNGNDLEPVSIISFYRNLFHFNDRCLHTCVKISHERRKRGVSIPNVDNRGEKWFGPLEAVISGVAASSPVVPRPNLLIA